MRLVRRIDALRLLALTALLVGAPVQANAEGPHDAMRAFGPSSSTIHTVQAAAFNSTSPGSLNFSGAFAQVCVNAGGCTAAAPVMLPTGAVVTAMELQACDGDNSNFIAAQLRRVGPFENSQTILAEALTGAIETPGCDYFFRALDIPETIDNFANTYIVHALFDSNKGFTNTRLQAVRLFYRLQVSPAPAVATFGDVPTSHPFFPFIQALVAAGITTGCSDSPPLFCPDGVVTRKQLAKFLSTALGLHWAQ